MQSYPDFLDKRADNERINIIWIYYLSFCPNLFSSLYYCLLMETILKQNKMKQKWDKMQKWIFPSFSYKETLHFALLWKESNLIFLCFLFSYLLSGVVISHFNFFKRFFWLRWGGSRDNHIIFIIFLKDSNTFSLST